MVALGNAARHLQVDVLVGVVRCCIMAQQFAQYLVPLWVRERVADAHSGQAVIKARQVFRKTEQFSAIGRDYFVYTVTEDKPRSSTGTQACSSGKNLPFR
jgi:hypothetical protein